MIADQYVVGKRASQAFDGEKPTQLAMNAVHRHPAAALAQPLLCLLECGQPDQVAELQVAEVEPKRLTAHSVLIQL